MYVCVCVCVCVCVLTGPARTRGRCVALQRARELGRTPGSRPEGSSRSSMRGFFRGSGLVSGVTLFLRIREPGPRFTSYREREEEREEEREKRGKEKERGVSRVRGVLWDGKDR